MSFMGVRWRQECMGVHGYEWVRLSVRGWVHVGVCVGRIFRIPSGDSKL